VAFSGGGDGGRKSAAGRMPNAKGIGMGDLRSWICDFGFLGI
jgi:hypothetical protein